MKRKLFLLGTLALMVAGGIFWSCQKDELLVNPENGLMLKSETLPTISFSADNACQNSPLTVTVDIKQVVSCGEIRIDMKAPGAADWEDGWFVGKPINGVASKTFSPTLEGEYYFRANYTRERIGTGSTAYWCGESIGWFPNANTGSSVTVESCGCSYDGDELAAELVGAPEDLGDGWYKFVVKWTFTSEDGTSVKIKGGLTAGADGAIVDNVDGAVYEYVGTPEKNAQVEWSGTVAECGIKEITVTFQRKWNGKCDDITGDWTAKKSDGVEIGYAEPVTVGDCEIVE